jgi:hypothetical protein
MTINNLVKGMEILAKYLPNGSDTTIGGADRDLLYVCPPDVQVSPEDAAELGLLGWYYDTTIGWAVDL